MFPVNLRLMRFTSTFVCRVLSTSVICGSAPLSRARIATAIYTKIYNLQSLRPNSTKQLDQSIPSESLLEKQVAILSSDIHQKNRVYKNDFLRVLNNVKENNYSNRWQGLLLLRCSADMLPDESPASRLELAEEVWEVLKKHTKFTVDHYNELLRCYVANGKCVDAKTFLKEMSPVKANETTYELLLEMLCEAGKMDEATEIITKMKNDGVAASEKTFNSLIIGQGRNKNLEAIDEILMTMITLKLGITKNTHTAVAKAYFMNKNVETAVNKLETARNGGIKFEEADIVPLVKLAALLDLKDAVKKLLKFLPPATLNSPSISAYMQSYCVQLVYQNRPMAALDIYNCLPLPAFGPSDDLGLHGRSLIRDCVKASLPSSMIGKITDELMSSGRNPIALQCACEAALQLGKIPLALALFTKMKQKNIPVRPHYFWPIIISNSRRYGEKGALQTLMTMMEMEVKPDYETLFEFVLPCTSFNSPPNLMKKLKECGLTVSEVLTPMMHVLIASGQIRAASELCELFVGKVDSERLMDPLVKGYMQAEDAKSTVYILEDITKRAAQKNNDWVGRFVYKLATHKKMRHDVSSFVALVRALKENSQVMSSAAMDSCLTHFSQFMREDRLEELRLELESITDNKLVDESEAFLQRIPHPRSMNTSQLESHLIELENAGMNTRGTLRKLLQTYCRENNLTAAREIVDKCHKQQVDLSAGMKASIFDMYVRLGELESAELALADLNKSVPNFHIDEFKLLGYATLLVKKGHAARAFEVVEKMALKRRSIGGKEIEQNCFRLLDAIASAGTYKQTQNMLNLLLQNKYCKPTNIILGPLVRVHLKNDDLSSAVGELSRIAEKHRCTPLKLVVLCKALGAAGPDSDPATNQHAQTVLQADRKIHGAPLAQISLIAALAELNYKKQLRRIMLDPKARVDPQALLRQCQRFADESKPAQIECVIECCKGVRDVDRDRLYEIMLQVYQRSDDWQGALGAWYKVAEEDRRAPRLAAGVAAVLRANRRPVPPDLLAALDADARGAV